MKSKEEIEYAAANLANPNVCKTTNWIEGYTQCQEDIRELLLEIKNNWKGNKLIGGTYEKICNSLNKQD